MVVEVEERNQKQPRKQQQQDLEKENLKWSKRKNDSSQPGGVGHAELG